MQSSRRQWLALAGASLWAKSAWAATDPKKRQQALVFPRDHGAHPEYQTEWWYVTGHAGGDNDAPDFGFQITFFRTRVEETQALKSSLAARQLLFAHAAVTDVAGKKLWHDQRIARWSGAPPSPQSADFASASTGTTDVVLRDWSFKRDGAVLHAKIASAEFALDLRFTPTQPLLLQGEQGYSQKGPQASESSNYYSEPQLQARGTLSLGRKAHTAGAGSRAWLDHEWSHAMLPAGAVGWDWIGINLFDGSALTAFQLRDAQGGALWDGGSFRSASQTLIFSRGVTRFTPLRSWTGTAHNTRYPVEWSVQTPAGIFTVKALVDNQELDSRQSTGAIYWEGLCAVYDQHRQRVGLGYLEMTGYAAPLRL
jgi:predicted secreted hydrolase